jgi:SAM-dependent methyltransferase
VRGLKNNQSDSQAQTMSQAQGEADKIGLDFDESACEFCERYKDSGLSKSSRLLLEFLAQDGIQGKSVLDLGCGAGGFLVESLKKGGSSAVGFDLSSKMIETANQLATANGFEDRAKFTVGNAATAALPSSDAVVMDKVICCYPDIDQLIKNATGASRALLGFVVPRDDGIGKWPLRIGVWIVNRWEKRRGGIFFYLHNLDKLDKTLRDSGFNRLAKKSSRFWLVFLYKRAQQPCTIPRCFHDSGGCDQ